MIGDNYVRPRLSPTSNGYAAIPEPELPDPPEPVLHMARVGRVFRHGAWQTAASCTCGWERLVRTYAEGQRLADQHDGGSSDGAA